MKVKATWVSGNRFIGATDNGRGVIMDGSQGDAMDGKLGPSPMEMLLLGMAGCSGIDVVHILERMRQPVSGCEISVQGHRGEEHPRVFHEIDAVYTVSGAGLSEKKVAEAVKLSAEKYCSASVMLGATAKINRRIEIIDTRENA